MNLEEMNNLAKKFLESAFFELRKNEIELKKHWSIDHLCFRATSEEDYQFIKKQFQSYSKILIETEVNGRLITNFKLYDSILFEEWEIDVIEVPAPKLGKTVKRGFEHFEVVADLPFDQIKLRYPNCEFDESGLKKNLNPELEISFENFALKFHPMSLESIVRLESNEKLISALKSSAILETLAEFQPRIVGVYPLNLYCAGSEFDILISSENLDEMNQFSKVKFSQFSDFNCVYSRVGDEKTVVISFVHQNIRFKVFGQKFSKALQAENKYFLIQEKLLKIGGEHFFKKVRNSIENGLKTKAAFSEALRLPSESFETLLNLQKKTDKELRKSLKFLG